MADHPTIAHALDQVHDLAMAMTIVARDEGVRDQVWFVVRALLLGIVGWGAISLVDARSELAVLKNQHDDFERRLLIHDQRILTGTDDRWRKRDHDAYAELIDKRIDDLSARVDAQGRNINELLRRTK